MHQNATDRLDEAACQLFGINRTDGRCLDILDRRGKLTAGELGQESGLSSGAVTALIDRMERADYLRRVPDPGDRRKVMLELTERMGEISALVYGRFSEIGSCMMGQLTDAQIQFVTRFLMTGTEMNRALALRLSLAITEAPDGADPLEMARGFSDRMLGEAETVAAGMDEAVDRALADLTAPPRR